MKVNRNHGSSGPYQPKTIHSELVSAKLNRQHTRWLLTEYPDYNRAWRNAFRFKRQLQIEASKRLNDLKDRHPLITRGFDLLLISVLITAVVMLAVFLIGAFMNAPPMKPVKDEIDWRQVFGWVPIGFAFFHLIVLALVKIPTTPRMRIRPFVVWRQFHWVTASLIAVYSIPIMFAATQWHWFITAIGINGLLFVACSRTIRLTGIWLISRRSGDLSKDTYQQLIWPVAILWLILVFAPICIAILTQMFVGTHPDNGMPKLQFGSVVHFLESIATGDTTWWILAIMAGSMVGLFVLQNRIAAKRTTIAFKRQLVRGCRDDATVTMEELVQMAFDTVEPEQVIDARARISQDFAVRRWKPRYWIGKLLPTEPLALLVIPLFALLYALFGFMAHMLFSLSHASPLEFGATNISKIYLLFLATVAAPMEVASLMAALHHTIRPAHARPISHWRIWLESQQRSTIVVVRSLIAAIPIIALAIWSQGYAAHIPIGIGLVVAGHLAFGNVVAAFQAVSGLWPLVPKLSAKWIEIFSQLLALVLMISLFPITIAIVYVSKEWGIYGLMALAEFGLFASGTIYLIVIVAKRIAFANE